MFDRLTGNERIKSVLRSMLAAGRASGSLLFAGEEGVGKKHFALELAKAFNCHSPQNHEACDICSSCVRISKSEFPDHASTEDKKTRIIWSNHPDVALVRPYLRIVRIPLMRELEREANFRPFEGRARFFLIEDADRLNNQSASALLKTLEEPPPTTHIILLTSRPDSLLPTIRSRVQILRFAPLTAAEIEAYLLARGGLTEDDARIAAGAARGSIGRALSIDVERLREQREEMLKVLNALAPPIDRTTLLRSSESMADAKQKDDYEARLDLLASLIHDVWTVSLGAREGQIFNDDLRAQLSKLGGKIEGRRAASWLSQIETHRRGLDVNINRKVATDSLLLSMAEA